MESLSGRQGGWMEGLGGFGGLEFEGLFEVVFFFLFLGFVGFFVGFAGLFFALCGLWKRWRCLMFFKVAFGFLLGADLTEAFAERNVFGG